MGRPGAPADANSSHPVPPADPNQDLYGLPPQDDDEYDYSYPHKPQENKNHHESESAADTTPTAFPPPPPPPPHQFEYEYDVNDKPQAFPPPPPPPPPQPQNHGFMHPPQFPPVQPQPNIGIQMGHPAAAAPPPQPVIGFQPAVMASPMMMNNVLLQNKPWSTHLFDCMSDPQNAIITCFFPCVTFGQIAEIVDSGNTSCATSGMLYTLIAFCIAMPCIMSCSYRSKMRAKFGLMETPAPDWIIHCFCEHCALCQEYRQLQQQGYDPSIGWVGNLAMQQHKQQMGIAITPPMQQRMM